MPTIPVFPALSSTSTSTPLPPLLETPAGLAILELQGTLHTPLSSSSSIDIGRLVFPLFSSGMSKDDLSWTKKVYLYVGKNQRMTGSLKKLDKPLAILKRAEGGEGGQDGEVRIMDIVKWKIMFSARPEPVGERLSE